MKKAKKYFKKTGIVGVIVAILYIVATLWAPEDYTDDPVETSNALVQFEDNLQIHFIDQTTPNMIQGLKGIFARKPLISRGI